MPATNEGSRSSGAQRRHPYRPSSIRETTASHIGHGQSVSNQNAVRPIPDAAKDCASPLLALENSKKMGAREQQHAGDVITFVVASRWRNDFVEACRRQRDDGTLDQAKRRSMSTFYLLR